jgi:hypothetical protein
MVANQPVRASAGTVNRSERCADKVRVVRGADAFVWPRVYAIGEVLKALIGFRGTDLSGVSEASTCEERWLEESRDASRP